MPNPRLEVEEKTRFPLYQIRCQPKLRYYPPAGSPLVLYRIRVKVSLAMGRKSDSRQRLMDAAHELIWGYSYGAVTIEAICERAGVKKGSFYYFFNSKSDLAVAAINAWWDERRALVQEMFRPEVPPLERIGKYLDFVIQRQIEAYEESGQVLGCPLFTLGSEISTQDERIGRLFMRLCPRSQIVLKTRSGKRNHPVKLRETTPH